MARRVPSRVISRRAERRHRGEGPRHHERLGCRTRLSPTFSAASHWIRRHHEAPRHSKKRPRWAPCQVWAGECGLPVEPRAFKCPPPKMSSTALSGRVRPISARLGQMWASGALEHRPGRHPNGPRINGVALKARSSTAHPGFPALLLPPEPTSGVAGRSGRKLGQSGPRLPNLGPNLGACRGKICVETPL